MKEVESNMTSLLGVCSFALMGILIYFSILKKPDIQKVEHLTNTLDQYVEQYTGEIH